MSSVCQKSIPIWSSVRLMTLEKCMIFDIKIHCLKIQNTGSLNNGIIQLNFNQLDDYNVELFIIKQRMRLNKYGHKKIHNKGSIFVQVVKFNPGHKLN